MARKFKVKDDIIPKDKLELWITLKQNVLLRGKHGVGKTSIILKAWKRAGLRYAYFSGATMDPFIDFVGVPIIVTVNGKKVIRLKRPEHLLKLDVQALFFDEFNRTHKKIRNAVMELIQFKTINGKPLSSDLQMVWAAINPDDDESQYDVDRLDPAQADRFQVQFDLPYQCSASYFKFKFGDEGITAVRWWNKLSKEQKDEVSPRRLESAMRFYTKKGDIRDVLPVSCNPGKLVSLLQGGGYQELDKVLKAYKKGVELDATDDENDDSTISVEDWFKNESNYATYIDEVVIKAKYRCLLEVLSDEKLTSLLVKPAYTRQVRKYIGNQISKGEGALFLPVLKNLARNATNTPLRNWCDSAVGAYESSHPTKKNKAKVAATTPKFKSIKYALLETFKVARNSNKPILLVSIQRSVEMYVGRSVSKVIIERRIARYAPWISKKEGITINKTVFGSYAIS